MAKQKSNKSSNGATIGYEQQLWQMADALRSSMDAAEYKHVVLGLIFLKYISDAFEEQHAKLEAEKAQGADPEDPDEYRALNIFWVPPEARWWHLKAQAKQPTIGEIVEEGTPVQLVPEGTPGAAVVAIKRVNELGFYNLSPTQLAEKAGLSGPKMTALVRHLNLRSDPECFTEILIRKSKFNRYSQKAIDKIKKEFPIADMQKVWAQYGPSARRQSNK